MIGRSFGIWILVAAITTVGCKTSEQGVSVEPSFDASVPDRRDSGFDCRLEFCQYHCSNIETDAGRQGRLENPSPTCTSCFGGTPSYFARCPTTCAAFQSGNPQIPPNCQAYGYQYGADEGLRRCARLPQAGDPCDQSEDCFPTAPGSAALSCQRTDSGATSATCQPFLPDAGSCPLGKACVALCGVTVPISQCHVDDDCGEGELCAYDRECFGGCVGKNHGRDLDAPVCP